MNKLILILLLLLFGCAPSSLQKSTCQNNGRIDFIYINIPCDECVTLIESIFENNLNIFSYDTIRNKESHIMVNYCYNYKKITPQGIERILIDNNFPINKPMTETQKLKLSELCCNNY